MKCPQMKNITYNKTIRNILISVMKIMIYTNGRNTYLKKMSEMDAMSDQSNDVSVLPTQYS